MLKAPAAHIASCWLNEIDGHITKTHCELMALMKVAVALMALMVLMACYGNL